MTSRTDERRRVAAHIAAGAALAACLAAVPAAAQSGAAQPPMAGDAVPAAMTSDNYDELFLRYLEAARTPMPARGPDIGWMSSLAGDQRARNVNDLVTVQVIESITGLGTADSSLNKKSDGGASVTSLFGLESKFPSWLDPTSLAATSSNTDFKGGGTTSRVGQLTAVMTVRVTEVLPNGYLVLEGAREIDINGDRQIVVLTGVVRPADLTPQNVVLSTQIGQLRIRYFGRGLIRDNLKPGWLIRVLNKIF